MGDTVFETFPDRNQMIASQFKSTWIFSAPTDLSLLILNTSILVFGERDSVSGTNDLWQLHNPTKPGPCRLYSLGRWVPNVGLEKAEIVSTCRTVATAALWQGSKLYLSLGSAEMNSLYLVKAYLHGQSLIFKKLKMFCIKYERMLKSINSLMRERVAW